MCNLLSAGKAMMLLLFIDLVKMWKAKRRLSFCRSYYSQSRVSRLHSSTESCIVSIVYRLQSCST